MGFFNLLNFSYNNNKNSSNYNGRNNKRTASINIALALSLLLITSVFVTSSHVYAVVVSDSSFDSSSTSSITTVSTTPPTTQQQPPMTQQQQQQLQQEQQPPMTQQQQQQLQQEQLQQQLQIQEQQEQVQEQQQVQQAPTATPTSASTKKNTPVTIQLSGTSPNLNNPSLDFSISSNPAHGTLSEISESGLSSSVIYTPKSDFIGSDSFSFIVTDIDTGKSSSPARVSITVTNQLPIASSASSSDTTPPTVIATPPRGTYNTAQSVILIANEPSTTIYYTTDGSSSNLTTTTDTEYTGTPITISNEGTTTLRFFGIDTAGNTGMIQTEIYTIDTTSPAAPTILNPNQNDDRFGSSSGGNITIEGTAEPGSSVQVFDIGGTAIGTATADASTGSFTLTTTLLPDGIHSLTSTATDVAGNTGASSSPVIITINTTIPTVVIDSAIDGNGNPVPNGGYTSSNSITFRFTVSANEPGGNDLVRIYCWGSHIAFDPLCTSPKTYSNLPSSSRIVFNVQPTDIVDNGETATWSWTIDNIPNTIRIADPPNGATGVPVTSSIKAIFNWEFSGSSPMNTSTINTNTFTLKDNKNNTVSGRIESGPECPQVDYGCNVIFFPSQPLAYSTTYTATITTDVKDMAGNPISPPASWRFTTEAFPQPPQNLTLSSTTISGLPAGSNNSR